MTYTVAALDADRDGLPGGEHRQAAARYRLVTDYVTDPRPRRRGDARPGCEPADGGARG